MGVLNLSRVGWITVNPDSVAAGEWFTWRKCLRVHPWPTDGEDTVVARHPGGRIVWVIGMNEDGRATDFVSLEIGGEIGPGKFGDHQIIRRKAGWNGDESLCPGRETKIQSAVAFFRRSPEGDGLVEGRPCKFEVY